MTDRLTEITVSDLPKLRDLYRPEANVKKSYIGFTAIENYIDWLRQDAQLATVTFYCLNDDFSDGTFALIDDDSATAYADTLNESQDNLKRLLQLIDYSKGYFFLSERSELQTTITSAVTQSGAVILSDTATLLYYLPKEKAAEFDDTPPSDIHLKQVTKPEDVSKANSVWPHRNPKSLTFITRMAKYNPSVGAYKPDDTFVAWVFRLPSGLLGALQTDEHYFGKGYGSLVVKGISKKIAQRGHDIYAGIFEANAPSRGLFGKLGFVSVGEVRWIMAMKNPPADLLGSHSQS